MKLFVDRLIDLSSSLTKEFFAQSQGQLDNSLVTISELWALDYLVKNGNATMKDLSAAVFLKTSSTTSLVDRLIERGFVIRERSEGDRRVIRVKATPKGKKVWKNMHEAKRKSLKKIFKSLSETERDQYLQILEKVVSHLEGSSS